MILYGFIDIANKNYEIISREYLENYYPNLQLYASDVIRNCGADYVIGIRAIVLEDGKASYTSSDAFNELMKFIRIYEKHHNVIVKCQYIPVIFGDYENSEYAEYEIGETDYDGASLISTHSSRPSTPTNQRTKPASTNAPERPSRCRGCQENQPNQMAHIGVGGCLKYDSGSE